MMYAWTKLDQQLYDREQREASIQDAAEFLANKKKEQEKEKPAKIQPKSKNRAALIQAIAKLLDNGAPAKKEQVQPQAKALPIKGQSDNLTPSKNICKLDDKTLNKLAVGVYNSYKYLPSFVADAFAKMTLERAKWENEELNKPAYKRVYDEYWEKRIAGRPKKKNNMTRREKVESMAMVNFIKD